MSKSAEYEMFVRDVTQALLDAQGLGAVKAQHDVMIPGMSRSYQVDVYWEYALAGVQHRVIINCKCYSSTVEVGDVLALQGVIDDVPGVRGLIITTVGFQAGAVAYAKRHGIGLKVIRPPVDADYGNRIREVVVHLDMRIPELTGMFIQLDRSWAEANGKMDAIAALGGKFTHTDGPDRFERASDGEWVTLSELFQRAVQEHTDQGGENELGVPYSRMIDVPDIMWVHRDAGALKLEHLVFDWHLRPPMVDNPPIRVRYDLKAIVQDALDGSLLRVDTRGIVSGDTASQIPNLSKKTS